MKYTILNKKKERIRANEMAVTNVASVENVANAANEPHAAQESQRLPTQQEFELMMQLKNRLFGLCVNPKWAGIIAEQTVKELGVVPVATPAFDNAVPFMGRSTEDLLREGTIRAHQRFIAGAPDEAARKAEEEKLQHVLAFIDNQEKRRAERYAKAERVIQSIMAGQMDHADLLDDAEAKQRFFSFSPETAELIISCARIKTDAVINAIVSDPDNDEEKVIRKLAALRSGLLQPLYR